jgi:predicted dehydrogenase
VTDEFRVGIIGTGTIVSRYVDTLVEFPHLTVAAMADLDRQRAAEAAARVPGCRAVQVDELLDAADVELVINLTPPSAHATVSRAALRSGKHVYSEKPLAVSREYAADLVREAERRGLVLACAPDTVLASPVQSARHLIDRGLVGDCIAASAAMTVPGHEAWHHAPDFYYQPGGGPLLDMGPYYLSALVHLLGPVDRVSAMTSRSRDHRRIRTGPRAGVPIPVAVDTHVAAVLRHRRGTLTTMTMSFDVIGSTLPHIEVYGSRASIAVPNPNRFDGAVRILADGTSGWEAVAPIGGFAGCSRGYGVAEAAAAIRAGRAPRTSAELALHVVDVMETILRAAESGRTLDVATECERPEPVALTDRL